MAPRMYLANQPSPPPLAQPLSVILPTEEQTWLLRTCLWSGPKAQQAWVRWRETVKNPIQLLQQDDVGIRGLLPLLFRAVRTHDIAVERELQTTLRTAYLREEVRARLYRNICRDVLVTFERANVEAIVLKGAALADTIYPDPITQHAHYLDMLVKPDDLARATPLLTDIGFARTTVPTGPIQSIEVEHQSGLPLVLHCHLFPLPFYNIATSDLRDCSVEQSVADVPARTLSDTDSLLHVCGYAFFIVHHESLRWACDAWFLIENSSNLDWELLLQRARDNHLALPLAVTLHYLADELDASVPADVLERLDADANATQRIGREAALFGARLSARGSYRSLINHAGSWRGRRQILQWMLFPTPRYMSWVRGSDSSRWLPLEYVRRPWSYAKQVAKGQAYRITRPLRQRLRQRRRR